MLDQLADRVAEIGESLFVFGQDIPFLHGSVRMQVIGARVDDPLRLTGFVKCKVEKTPVVGFEFDSSAR